MVAADEGSPIVQGISVLFHRFKHMINQDIYGLLREEFVVEVLQPVQKGVFARRGPLVAAGITLAAAVLVAAGLLVYLLVLKGQVKITGLKLSPENPVFGRPAEMLAQVENNGLLTAQYRVALLVDGREEAAQDLNLAHGAAQTVRLDITGLAPGSHKASVGGQVLEFNVLKPAAFMVENLALDTGKAFVGDEVTARATVKNVGGVSGVFHPAFLYDGAKLDTEPVELPFGAQATVEAKLRVAKKGAHAVSLEDLQQTFTAVNPAKIAAVSLALSTEFANPGETVSATATLMNIGDVAGTSKVDALVNGEAVTTRAVTLVAGAKTTLEFKITQSKTGKYVVSLGGMEQTLHVVALTRPKNGELLVKTASGGLGEVTVMNYFQDKDALFVLADASNPGKAVLAVYVRRGCIVSDIKVKDGVYTACFTAGTGFDSVSRLFSTDADYKKFTANIELSTAGPGDDPEKKTWWMPVSAQTVDVKAILEMDFPE